MSSGLFVQRSFWTPTGGTDGQVLTKASSVDGDYGWEDAGATDYYIRALVDRTLPNDTNVNAIFNDPANGALTLPTGVYKFKGQIVVTSMSGTSGNALVTMLGAGTATLGVSMMHSTGVDLTTINSTATESGAHYQDVATGASAASATTGTVLRLDLEGMFDVTVAGTIIPSIDLVTAAAAVLEAGSFLIFTRIGPTGAASVGPWS